MRLSFVCSQCHTQNVLKERARDRFELKKLVGKDELLVSCKSCGKKDKKHLNRIDAIEDNHILMLGIVFGIVTTVMVFLFGFIALFTFLIPIYFWRNEMDKKRRFNSTLIQRKNVG